MLFVFGSTMRVVVLSSGGKDSTYACWWALMRGWDVIANVTVAINGDDSMMFQIPGTEIVKYQSRSAGIEYVGVRSEGIPEVEINEVENALRNINMNYDAIVSGALRSDYQKTRIERMCENLEKISFTPLWHNDSVEHLHSLCNHGFEVIISAVSCEGLTADWIGKTLTKDSLEILDSLSKKYGFNVDGEGGEYETVVLNAPYFEKRIAYEGNRQWDGVRGHLKFDKFSLSH